MGLFTKRNINQGEIIAEYRGAGTKQFDDYK